NKDLQIKSRNGMVRLSGTVIDASHMRLASEAITSLPGVVGVINQLTEKSGGPAESTDQWLVNNVPSTLFFDQDVQTEKRTVSAFDGMVMRGGMTGNATEKELAGTFTSDVRGVDLVVDNRTVAGEGNAAQ
ncbi:MAG: BON domain-containing protein, partial [Desulfofustis sp.]|nr:BON domain-containing protein [Desulfofustis sp.]